MNESLYFRRDHNIAARHVGDELMIMSARDSSLFSLNETAAVLWNAADGDTALSEVVAREICPRFDVDSHAALRDALELVQGLAEHGILHLSAQPFAARSDAP